MSPRLQVIVGSTRPGRVGLPVSQWFEGFARSHGAFDVELVDLAEVALPIFDELEHPKTGRYAHEHTKRWSAIAARGDAYVWVIPEYNYAVNAATKNAIDYLNREWAHKPLGIVSYGGVAAGTRAAQMLRQIVSAVRMVAVTDAVHIPFVQSFMDDGRFVPNDEVLQGATLMLDELSSVQSALRILHGETALERTAP